MTNAPSGGGARRLLSWLPVLMLLGGVTNHLWFVQRHQLSPWLGAGFGMFSTTDVGSTRQVHITAELADGSRHWVELQDPYRDVLERARALPADVWLERLAQVTFEALEAGGDLGFSAEPRALHIEVWRNRYESETLEASAVRLADRAFALVDDEG